MPADSQTSVSPSFSAGDLPCGWGIFRIDAAWCHHGRRILVMRWISYGTPQFFQQEYEARGTGAGMVIKRDHAGGVQMRSKAIVSPQARKAWSALASGRSPRDGVPLGHQGRQRLAFALSSLVDHCPELCFQRNTGTMSGQGEGTLLQHQRTGLQSSMSSCRSSFGPPGLGGISTLGFFRFVT